MNVAFMFSKLMARFTISFVHSIQKTANSKAKPTARKQNFVKSIHSRATDRLISRNSMFDSNLISKLHEMMLKVNSLAQKYRMMVEVERTKKINLKADTPQTHPPLE